HACGCRRCAAPGGGANRGLGRPGAAMTRTHPITARVWPLGVALIALVAFPHVGGKFYIDLVLTMMILAIFALSLELLVGRTGLVSFGHAAFFGIAAYSTALVAPTASAPSLALLLPA